MTGVAQLKLGASLPPSARYATLSHRWGGSNPPKLLTSNIAEYSEGPPLHRLTRTYRDAITVTLRVELSYLWPLQKLIMSASVGRSTGTGLIRLCCTIM